MPIIDDQDRGTDRQPAPKWAWIIAIVMFCGFWLALATLGMMGQYFTIFQSSAAPAPSPSLAVRSMNATMLQQAEAARSRGDWGTAGVSIDAIDNTAPMDYLDKHTYLRIGALSKAKNGTPGQSAEFYDRFLSMGTQVRSKDCQSCHSNGTVSPGRVSDLEGSDLGAEYWRQLKLAGTLDKTRKQLRKEWKRMPKDPRLNLLLYHLEKRSSDPSAAVKHSRALRAIR